MKISKKRSGLICMFVILLAFLINVNILSAQISIVNSKEIETSILDKLNESSEVSVIIELNSKNKGLVNSLLSNLSESEFKLKETLLGGEGFAGNITKEGFDKLINSQDVRLIYLNKDWHVLTQQSLPLINATQVWANGYTGKDQTICVIDTGINWTHPALGGCFGSGCKVIGGYNEYSNNNNSMDDNGHGTNIAGIIAAKGTINGTAPDAKLIAMKACDSTGNSCPTNDIINSITWCINNRTTYNISIISISLGGGVYADTDCPIDARTQINNAYANNISVIISSGNGGYTTGISWPACRGNVTSVGSVYDENLGREPDGFGTYWSDALCYDPTTTADTISCFTNRYSNLDLLAPGCRINSTYVGGGYDYECGTSQAAPHVAGAAALLLERRNDLTPDNITTILKNTGINIYDNYRSRNNGGGSNLTFKRIDVLAAINSLCTVTNWVNGSCGAGLCASTERQRTRTATPSACTTETDCISDTSCVPSGGSGSNRELTVCSSGCNYTKIGTAINNSDANDRIFVTDSGTYNEQIKMNATTSGVLECQNGAVIKGSNTGTGIYLKRGTDGFVIKNCIFDSFNYGFLVDNSSHGDLINVVVNNSGVIGLLLKDESSDVRIRNISVLETTGDNAVLYDGDWWSASIVSSNLLEDSIIKKSSAAELIWIDYGIDNEFLRNNLSEGAGGFQGLLLKGHGNTGFHLVQENNIFDNNWGVYLDDSDNNQISGNIFCPSNDNEDITLFSSISNGGTDNTCEKPGSWSDSGTTGCTFFCDSSASVTLLYPLDTAVDTDGDVSLVCQSNDNYQLINVSLYHNISGSFLRNQTANISGTSNITTFQVNNVPNQTVINWNCLAYDNASRGSFANSNWTLNINMLSPPPDDTHKFYIKNSSGNNVAWFGSWGTIVLAGNCSASSNCVAPTNSFIVRNSTDNATSYIDNSGNLCVEKGDCSAQSASCNPTRSAFIVKNSSNKNVSYIDYDGDLCLVGQLYENSEYL